VWHGFRRLKRGSRRNSSRRWWNRDISQVNRGANQTGTASQQVLTSAKSLAAESGHLNAKVETFLASVRAA
jgi:hypothetical protein